MPDTTTIYVVGGGLLVGGVSAFVVSRRRHRRDLSQYLVPELQKCGVTFVSAIYPGSFKVGPFPKFEVKSGRPQTSIIGMRGEYNEYRIVNFSDDQGRVHHLWALVEFERFQLRRVRWRAEQKAGLPAGVLTILEN